MNNLADDPLQLAWDTWMFTVDGTVWFYCGGWREIRGPFANPADAEQDYESYMDSLIEAEFDECNY